MLSQQLQRRYQQQHHQLLLLRTILGATAAAALGWSSLTRSPPLTKAAANAGVAVVALNKTSKEALVMHGYAHAQQHESKLEGKS